MLGFGSFFKGDDNTQNPQSDDQNKILDITPASTQTVLPAPPAPPAPVPAPSDEDGADQLNVPTAPSEEESTPVSGVLETLDHSPEHTLEVETTESVEEAAPIIDEEIRNAFTAVTEPEEAPEEKAEEPREELAPLPDMPKESGTFSEEVVNQIETVLEQDIEKEQEAIDQEEEALNRHQTSLEEEKAKLEQLKKDLEQHQEDYKAQQEEIERRNKALESRKERMQKILQDL
jgi:flagellar capping protein FliD